MLGSSTAMYVGPIEAFMTTDHARLDRLLASAETEDGAIDEAAYTEFREGLLRHIAMEEKVLLPLCRARWGESLAIASRLHADHGAIAKLLVRRPDRALLDAIRAALAEHNPLEDGPDGLYAIADAIVEADARDVVARLRAMPRVPLAPYYEGPPHGRSL